MNNPFKIGDRVFKNYPFDGSPKSGYPDRGKIFRIEKIENGYPDRQSDINAVCWLVDDEYNCGCSWSYYWNLSSINIKK